MEELKIRAEATGDQDAVRRLNVVAFPTSAEAMLVDDLRLNARPLVSLVAERDDVVVGHILFSPVSLAGHPELSLMGLAPMAVAPDYQRQGIGSALVEAGLDQCEGLGVAAVVVLGHPEYYPRFGFVPAARFDISSDYDVPEEVFMLLELKPNAMADCSGCIHYHPAFANV
jgi:putative acetyltransferase